MYVKAWFFPCLVLFRYYRSVSYLFEVNSLHFFPSCNLYRLLTYALPPVLYNFTFFPKIAYNRLDQDKREKIDIILNFTDFETQGFDNQLAAVADWADTVRYVSEYHWTGILHYINLADNKIKNGCPCQNNNEYSHPTKFKFHSEPYCHNQTDNTSCNFVYERDCVDGKCVAGAIHDLSMMVHNTSNFKDQLTSNDEKEWSHEFLKTRHTNKIKKSSNIQDNYKNLTNKQRLMFIIHFMGVSFKHFHFKENINLSLIT